MCDFHNYYDRIAERLPFGAKIIEVGVADGHSAIFLAEMMIKYNKDFEMVMVDNMDYGGEDQYVTVLTNIIKAGLIDKIRLLKLDSLVAACKFNDNWADFVFIDASHKYAETVADCRLWYHKVKTKKGILAGHDMSSVENPGVAQAVKDSFKEEFIEVIQTKDGLNVWQIKRTEFHYQLNTWPHHVREDGSEV